MTALSWLAGFLAIAGLLFACSVVIGGMIGFGSCSDDDDDSHRGIGS